MQSAPLVSFKLDGITTLWLLRVLCIFIFFCKNISQVPYFTPSQIFIFLTAPVAATFNYPSNSIELKNKNKISTVFITSYKNDQFGFIS